MSFRIRGAAGAAAVLLLLGAAACGDDDDTDDATVEDTSPEAEGAGIETACDALVEFNQAVEGIEMDDTTSEEDIQATGAELVTLFAPIAENAPDELSASAEELEAALDALAAGDAEAFNSDATFETYSGLVAQISPQCGFAEMAVTGADYRFEGIADTVEAGPTALSFTNSSSTEEHEVVLLRRADGVSATFDEIIALPEEEARSMVEVVGATFAPPGGEAGTLVELTPGQYAAVCFIPVGGAEDGPPHFTQGMLSEFSVE